MQAGHDIGTTQRDTTVYCYIHEKPIDPVLGVLHGMPSTIGKDMVIKVLLVVKLVHLIRIQVTQLLSPFCSCRGVPETRFG